MNFENTYVSNFQGAFRGLRNPLESWSKSDSEFGISDLEDNNDLDVAHLYCKDIELFSKEFDEEFDKKLTWLNKNGTLRVGDHAIEFAYIGPVDLNLAQRMIAAGSSDSKFLRQINVSVDITAPLYWQVSFCQ